jgi:hypothetical protein
MLTFNTQRKKYFVFSLLAFTLLLISSCSKDNNDGYERDKFLGDYSVIHNGKKLSPTIGLLPSTPNFDSTISGLDNSDINSIEISNFFNIEGFGAPSPSYVYAAVEDNSFTIPSQNVFGITFEGRGTISNGIISIFWTGTELSAVGYTLYFGTSVYTPK